MTTYDQHDVGEIRARSGIGNTVQIVIEKDHGRYDDYQEQTRYILNPDQAKKLYKSLKKAMYR